MTKFIIPDSEFFFTYSRSSGPGGQNVNKVNTKATMHWNARTNETLPRQVHERFLLKYSSRLSIDGVLTLTSQKTRSQLLNTADVIEKLYEMIELVAHPPKIRKATKPSRSAINKRLNEKKSHGDKKKSRQEKY
jgi:ribosome-associated protein